jgi:urease gamma subunit
MRLNDGETDCLLLSNAGFLAQKRLARGLLLNYPESVALISSQVNHNNKYEHKKEKIFIYF